ncbi:hypothetical protein Btru_067647 [Bulinus truncatus]|nr:hypothetical protein Btru_067647 [Bulinus truncatus]
MYQGRILAAVRWVLCDSQQLGGYCVTPKQLGGYCGDSQQLVLQFLQKHNLKGTEQLLKQEANVSDDDLKDEKDKKSEVSQALAAVYKSDDDPSLFEDLLQRFKNIYRFLSRCT